MMSGHRCSAHYAQLGDVTCLRISSRTATRDVTVMGGGVTYYTTAIRYHSGDAARCLFAVLLLSSISSLCAGSVCRVNVI